MGGNWTRIVQDERVRGGFRYFCKDNHNWFMTFDELRKLGDNGTPNDCPECAKTKAQSADNV